MSSSKITGSILMGLDGVLLVDIICGGFFYISIIETFDRTLKPQKMSEL